MTLTSVFAAMSVEGCLLKALPQSGQRRRACLLLSREAWAQHWGGGGEGKQFCSLDRDCRCNGSCISSISLRSLLNRQFLTLTLLPPLLVESLDTLSGFEGTDIYV